MDSKSTASPHAPLPPAAQTPTLTFANCSLEWKRSTRAVGCPQPALQSIRLPGGWEEASSKGALQNLCSCREASAGTWTSQLLGERRRSHKAFPAELPKCFLSPGAAGSSSHPHTAEEDAGAAHLSLQYRRLFAVPDRDIWAFANENQEELLSAGQPHFSPSKNDIHLLMPCSKACPGW